MVSACLVRLASIMGWMKSFSALSRFTFDHGSHGTESDIYIYICIYIAWDTARSPGKGFKKVGCQQGPQTKTKTVVINPKPLFFCGWMSHCVWHCVFRRAFRRAFGCTFRHVFRLVRACHLSCQRISIHVTTRCLCQMRWDDIKQHRKTCHHGGGVDMPKRHCLSHPLCLTTPWITRVTLIAHHPTKSRSKTAP